MLGFFSEPIKIYFLIWSVVHYLSNGGQICCFRVRSRLSFLDLFLLSSRESNESFLGATSVISRPYIFQVSITGKNFFCIKTSFKIMLCWKCLFSTTLDIQQSFGRLLGNRDPHCGLFLHGILVRYLNLKKILGLSMFYRANGQNRTSSCQSWGFFVICHTFAAIRGS